MPNPARPQPPQAPHGSGLSALEAARRLAQFGRNELPPPARRGIGRIVLGVLREPTFLLIAVAAVVYLGIGGLGEGLLLAGFAVVTIGLVVAQEYRSENALDALRALAAPSAQVLRDGQVRRIAAREVVPGDWLLVADGERVAADGVLRHADNVTVDESLLTGESVPVLRIALAIGTPATDATESVRVHAGTLLTSGRGMAEVTATGVNTQAGRIGASLAAIELEPTLLQRTFGRTVAAFAALAIAASVLVVLLFGWLRGAWLQGLLSGIAVAMSALPEELPMILAVFVAIGARRLARLHVLVRRTAAIEVLGACSVLCVDKTGTLTENRMRVQRLSTSTAEYGIEGDGASVPATTIPVLRCAMRASPRTSNDPMDAAVHRLAQSAGVDDALEGDTGAPVREHGLSRERPAIVRVWRAADGSLMAAAKGAPEAIADLCQLPADARARVLAAVDRQARAGLRVLALAQGSVAESALDFAPERYGLSLVGLIAFADPLRAGARAAIDAAHAAGVAVAMVTGDHPATALAIAGQAGIDCSAPLLTGVQVAALDAAGLRAAVRATRVFARIRPEQKLRIVQAFKDDGQIVAMTGDGVNDAPALKAAHIGLAMGQRGTDVAREAAAVVLLEDDLAHLIAGIAMGRRIYGNLRKACLYTVAIHVPIVGLALLPLLFGLPPMLMPTHVVLIELAIDPICAIACEAEPADADSMRQPPRRPDEPLLGLPQVALGAAQGAVLLAAAFAAFVLALAHGLSADAARTLSFLAFTAGNLLLVRVIAARGPALPTLLAPQHAAYWGIAAITAALTALCVGVPAVAALFSFVRPSPAHALLAMAAGLFAALALDAIKPLPSIQRILGHIQPRTASIPETRP